MSRGPREELGQSEAMQRYNAADASLDPETVAAIVAWLNSSRVGDGQAISSTYMTTR
ncbi:MAG: hypothetical protein ACYDC4_14345 [Candidatus Dormibacteria bacterium]